MRLMGSAVSSLELWELGRPAGQFVGVACKEEDDEKKATGGGTGIAVGWKPLPEEFNTEFFLNDEEEEEEGEESAPYFSSELFLRFFADPGVLPLPIPLTVPLALLLLALLLLALELGSVPTEGSLTRKCLVPERDLTGLAELGVEPEGSDDECAEGIWGEDEDTCLDELPYASCSPALCDVARAFRVVPYDSVDLPSCDWL